MVSKNKALARESDLTQSVNEELNSFSRRFYTNQLLQGLAVFFGTSLILLAFLSVSEFLLRNSSSVRRVLFYTFVLAEFSGLIYLVSIPLFRVFGLAGALKPKEMSKLVGEAVGKIDDKLLNLLELRDMPRSAVLSAAIRQKSNEILRFPFADSASIKKGIRFLQVSGIVLTGAIIAAASFPQVIDYGTKRIIYFDKELAPPAPFEFVVEGFQELAVRNEPYEITLLLEGQLLPKDVAIFVDEEKDVLRRLSSNKFEYTISNVKEDFKFQFTAEGFKSEYYQVHVEKRPVINNFSVSLVYPTYLNRKTETLNNVGNLTIPEGTRVQWRIGVEDGNAVELSFGRGRKILKANEGAALFDSTFRSDARYSMQGTAVNNLKSDSISFRIDALPDQYPNIDAREEKDSLNGISLFLGRYSDDHGLTSFRFAYFAAGESTPTYEKLKLSSSTMNSDFAYEVDWGQWDLKKGERIKCFFEVGDNDGINGIKYSRSPLFYYEVPDNEALALKRDDLSQDIEDALKEVLKESKEINKEIDQLKKDMLDKKKLDWEEREKIENLLRKNEALKQKMDDINLMNEQKNTFENRMDRSPELAEKREQLQRLMSEVLDEEMLEKIKELEKLLDEINKDRLNQKMEDIELSNEQLENELDRSLELFKKLEFEIKLQEAIQKIDELSQKQEEVAENVDKEGINDSNKEEQKEINKEFDEWTKDLDDLEEKNSQLQEKQPLEDQRENISETKEELNEAKNAMEKGQKKKSGENQKKAAGKMAEMKNSLKATQSKMKDKKTEDIKSLRNTLENLIELSFNQEALMNEMASIEGDDPKFNDLTKDQRAIIDGLEIVEDSLLALSKRVSEIEGIVNRELGKANQSMDRALRAMTERKLGTMAIYQQNAMTSLNNLSVLLDEVVDQLQKQMMESMGGQCKNPGNSKPSASSLQGLQKDLNKQLEEMKKMMEKGESGQGGMGKGEAEKLAKMAAEQAKLREELRKLAEGLGEGESGEIKKIGDLMEETEREIVNRQISRQTLMRQEEILTKLLESEKAERERDTEERREAQEGNVTKKGNLLNLEEYYRSRNAVHEEIVKENISLNRYYEQRAEEYFKSLSE
ncbi:MAG: DUF4175 family protein [Vicingaceae bacterium]